ncbi:transporter substrate-binding domain-containing protein [Aldersonia kunmingensis]|uniref:ABC transporter substrate-binding protein n=1 Tax=Aldersonia kunmingensis TaxID=408066 RepID=UPI0008316DD5|nr:transporter substrate-binding domain-containing protein [Aldersonia kunmingensis]
MSRIMGGSLPFLTVAVSGTLLLAGCGTASLSESAQTTADSVAPAGLTDVAATGCGPDSGKTLRRGILTIATDSPAYAPWFADNDPTNGRGFEGAVAAAVWERLGYARDRTSFISVPFNDALLPGPKPFDININQFTILDERRANVDFSSPYYSVTQAVVAMEGNRAARAQTLAELGGYRLGAMNGSTSLAAIEATLHPKTPPVGFVTNDEAKQALIEGRIDALIVDFPTGVQITEHEIPGSVLVGQFPRLAGATESFGVLLAKNSPLTPCVSAAVDQMYADGTLDKIAEQWLCSVTGVRVLA